LRRFSADPSDCEIEIVAVLDSGTDPVVERGLRRIAGDALRVVHYEAPFNFSTKINLGVSASSGDLLLLLNDDTEVLAPGSIDEMVALAQDPAVGMVGAKLLFGDGRLQHGGHVYNGVVSHALLGWPGDHPGPNRLLAVERECAGVTAAAALVPRSVHNEVGAMDPSFAINYNDVDYSLRIRATGRRIVWTPHACWYHFEHGSEPTSVSKAERELLEARWGEDLRRDPFYNPNLEPNRVDWLERPLMSGAPPYEVLPDGRLSWG
jgi:GT2 family glycosyltransferase